MNRLIEASSHDYRILVDPELGGSIAAFEWSGVPLLRVMRAASILGAASFPLVPFSNRIAHGRFVLAGKKVDLSPNLPESVHPHPLHGFGWLSAWKLIDKTSRSLRVEHYHRSGEWPWQYRAEQHFVLSETGLQMTLSATNLDESPMPCGLGFHPYFPREDAIYQGLHKGEWHTDDEGLPLALQRYDRARDWWYGQAVSTRTVDTAYIDRIGELTIRWPSRGVGITLTPSDNLPHTVVYVPAGENFFCVEPVSHTIDAINRSPNEIAYLEHGETMTVSLRMRAHLL